MGYDDGLGLLLCAQMWRALVFILLSLGLAACADEPTDATPDGALRLFLVAMDRSDHDARARADAYALLSAESRAQLTARAERATALARRRFEPWEMIAQGRYRLRFEARPGDGIEAEIDGDRAIVIVRGAEDQIARVPMLREDGRWRIDLVIPDMQSAGNGAAPRAPPP